MLKWLRSAGDKARLDQELSALGVGPHALPSPLRADLVSIVQSHIDSYRASESPSPIVFQSFFDCAFQLAAEVPVVIGAPKAQFRNKIDDFEYGFIIDAIRNQGGGARENLIYALYKCCMHTISKPHAEFLQALNNK